MNQTELAIDIQNGPCWCFVAERKLTGDEISQVGKALDTFMASWSSHGSEVRAGYTFMDDRMIIIYADAGWSQVSGCSRDTLFRAIQSIGFGLGLNLMDRMQLPVRVEDALAWYHYHDLSQELVAGRLTPEALVFDTTVDTIEGLAEAWRPIERYLDA